MKSRQTVSRKLPTGDKRRGLEKHVKLVGEVIWAWNELHLAYAFTFGWAQGNEWSMGSAIWNAISNDTTQRNVLSEALDWSLKGTVAQRNALHWAIKHTNTLSRYRNDLVHGTMGWALTPSGSKPRFSAVGNPVGRLIRYTGYETEDGEIIQPDLEKLMRLLRGDLMQLAKYVTLAGRLLVNGSISTLPRRPKLHAHKYAQRTAVKLIPPARCSRRRNRLKPSRVKS